MLSSHLSFPETIKQASSSFWSPRILAVSVYNQNLASVPSPPSHLQGAFPDITIPFFSSSISMG